MSYSFIQRSASNFTDTTMRRMQLDPLIVEGSIYRVDFMNAYSNANADGALANGAVFRNMVQGASDATYAIGGGGASVIAGKKGISMPGIVETPQLCQIAFPEGFGDMRTESGDHDFVEHIWVKPLAGFPASANQWYGDRVSSGPTSPVFGATPTQQTLYTVAAGNAFQALMRAGGAAYSTVNTVAGAQTGLASLFTLAYVGGFLSLYLNAALVGTGTNGSGLGLPARRSHGLLTFTANPAAGETVTVNGVPITFVAAGAAGAQVNIGANATATAQALRTYINANRSTLNAFVEGAAAALTVLAVNVGQLVTLTQASAGITVGAPVAGRKLLVSGVIKGEVYAIAGEDLTASGRTAAAAIAAEYAGYRPKLVTAGLAA